MWDRAARFDGNSFTVWRQGADLFLLLKANVQEQAIHAAGTGRAGVAYRLASINDASVYHGP